ncbi:MAG: type I-E CRISPR-associated protein Cse1/CasA, partial [Nitrospinota bacterium]|nr:type I-E CRISPR-associated protein Cse1/CasA [Nitrospinota bacterium]
MDFNLIHEEWIPVKRESGKAQKIAPYQITSGPEDPIIAFNAPRPDFNGALAQFMIGLLQTTAAPEDEGEWEEWFNDPPAPEELKKKFATVEHAFNLGGDGPRFMQDYSLTDGEQKEINVLLLETPGAKALKENTDHFIKRNSLNRECMACCAISLFALQTNAPSGGAGHRTSLRGGGPLTTLIAGERTWQTIWLNVIGGDEFANLPGNMSLEDDIYKFPWLAATRTSEAKTGADTFPEHAHPVQMFWATPRRIRINLNSRTQGECNLCGESSDFNVTSFITKNYGVNYEGAWTHPLSPHRKQKDGLILPLHANPGGLSYRNWLGLAYADNENAVEPANVIHHYFNSARYIESSSYKLWAFGYDMEKMKARCWYEG